MDQIKDVIEDETDDLGQAERQNSNAEASTSDSQASSYPLSSHQVTKLSHAIFGIITEQMA